MKKIFFIFVLLLTGCASIFHGTNETILVKSEESGTKLYLNDNYIGTDAAIVHISKRNIKKTYIKAVKNGCETTQRKLETEIDYISFFGCFIDFCIITVGGIDYLATGAINRLTENNYFVTPVCLN